MGYPLESGLTRNLPPVCRCRVPSKHNSLRPRRGGQRSLRPGCPDRRISRQPEPGRQPALARAGGARLHGGGRGLEPDPGVLFQFWQPSRGVCAGRRGALARARQRHDGVLGYLAGCPARHGPNCVPEGQRRGFGYPGRGVCEGEGACCRGRGSGSSGYCKSACIQRCCFLIRARGV